MDNGNNSTPAVNIFDLTDITVVALAYFRALNFFNMIRTLPSLI